MPDQSIFESLTNYGALGIVVLALGSFSWYMFKQVLDENKRLQEKVEELEEKLRDCLRDN
jgi:hypothetical protein